MIYLAFVLYALVFWAVAWKRPPIALMLIFASAPLMWDLSSGGGSKFSISELNLFLAAPVCLVQCTMRGKRLSIGPLALPLIAYSTVCLFSSFQTWRGGEALNSLLQMFLYLVVAVLVFSSFVEQLEDLKLALYGLVVVGVFLAIMVIVTRSGFVLGIHKNGIGASLACTAIVCLELWLTADSAKEKRIMLLALTVIVMGLVLALSRGAWIGTFCGTLVLMTLRRRYDLLLRSYLILIPVIAIGWNLVPTQQKEYATGFSETRWNIQARYKSVDLAKNYYEQSPVYGMGVGLRKQYDATNLFWLTLAETGAMGLMALGLIHLTFFKMVWDTQKRIHSTDKLFSFIALGGALLTEKLVHGMVDHYWSRGAIMIAWASVGMAVGAYYASPRRQMTRELALRRAAAVLVLFDFKRAREIP